MKSRTIVHAWINEYQSNHRAQAVSVWDLPDHRNCRNKWSTTSQASNLICTNVSSHESLTSLQENEQIEVNSSQSLNLVQSCVTISLCLLACLALMFKISSSASATRWTPQDCWVEEKIEHWLGSSYLSFDKKQAEFWSLCIDLLEFLVLQRLADLYYRPVLLEKQSTLS